MGFRGSDWLLEVLCCNSFHVSLVPVADMNPGGEHGREDRLTDRIGLGVLTRLVHRDLVDEVLAETGRTERLPPPGARPGGRLLRAGYDAVLRRRLRGGDAQTRPGPAVSAFLGRGLAGAARVGAVPGTRPPGRRAGAGALR